MKLPLLVAFSFFDARVVGTELDRYWSRFFRVLRTSGDIFMDILLQVFIYDFPPNYYVVDFWLVAS